ncbi:hypothetical protein QCA50_008339 [Cerrena zonata]|uniref:C2H2-type domain-containing protein n=1 Tax=Cerrena zonata TaxID=2478898 RepID=A0AAW0GAZ7_9APHY
MSKCRYHPYISQHQRTYTSRYSSNDDTSSTNSRFRLRDCQFSPDLPTSPPHIPHQPSLSKTTTITPASEEWLSSTQFYPLASKDGYEALRRRIVKEAGKGEIKYDVNFRPFTTMDEMQKYFLKIAGRRLQEKLKTAAPKKREKPRIQCPMLTYDRKTGEIIDCKTTNSRPVDLMRHIKGHTAIPEFLCPKPRCGHRTRQKSNLAQHYRAAHDKKAWAECEFCGQLFVQQADRSRHYRQEHDIKSNRAQRGDGWKYAHETKQAAARRVKGWKPMHLVDATWNEQVPPQAKLRPAFPNVGEVRAEYMSEYGSCAFTASIATDW